MNRPPGPPPPLYYNYLFGVTYMQSIPRSNGKRADDASGNWPVEYLAQDTTRGVLVCD